MLLNRLLLKIETGQELTVQQEKRLAKNLGVRTSLIKTFFYVILTVTAILLLYVGIIGGYDPIGKELAYILAFAIVVLLIVLIVVPKIIRINKYLLAVDSYFKTRFNKYNHFDLYYIDQKINPHVRPLITKKLYLLTDGYHFLFVSDPFKDTIYKMPKYLTLNKKNSYLRIINKDVNENSQIMVRLEDVENFYLSSKNFPEEKEVKQTKLEKYSQYFFDQTSNYIDTCIVILKLKSGIIMRLSHEVYPVFKNLMPHKEKNNEF